MLAYLSENIGTLVIGAALLAIVAAIVVKLVRDRRKGKNPGCDCDCGECSHCPSHKPN